MERPPPESMPNFKRGQRRIWIVAAVVVVLGVSAVFALWSGVFEHHKERNSENREGCPCGCDHSEAMAAELRKRPSQTALREIDKSLATIAEREAAGYITERMILHRLRLRDLERELVPAETLPAGLATRPFARELPAVEDAALRARMELVVHGETTEIVADRPKLLRACFLLRMEIENLAGEERTVKKPEIVAGVPFPISRWYLNGEDGAPWDGVVKAGERKSVHVIGYLGNPLKPGAAIDATIAFESLRLHATTRARA